MSIKWMKAGFIIGFLVGVFLVALGTYSIYYFFAVRQFMEHAVGDMYGNYAIAGLILISVGLFLAKNFYPILIPYRKDVRSSARTCPFCGALVEADAEACGKCKQQLE
jgi:hypothetical protein